jgi:putative pyruvate formate lyase activating enzyme
VREAGERGRCGAGAELRVARAALHFWEEPPISGECGSGTVFFSYCPLGCRYCQNAEISHEGFGKPVTVGRLAEIFCELAALGAHNINLVTATQYVPQVVEALKRAQGAGMSVPVVFNTSGYELPKTLGLLDGWADIYLTDLKYVSPQLALRYSDAEDYPAVALRALVAMVEQVGEYTVRDGLMTRGVIVRHLLLPGHLDDSLEVLRTSFDAVGNQVCYSLMSQYTPMPAVMGRHDELSRAVREEEYARLIDYALDLGIRHSFMQEGDTAEESFIPPFDLTGV